MKVQCTTLFDITKTGVSGRRGLLDSTGTFSKSRSQQTNLDTLLQVISLRSQPEEITDPAKTVYSEQDFGTNYSGLGSPLVWTFTFTVNQTAAFTDQDGNPLGLLNEDCHGVPMITGLDEVCNLSNQLQIDPVYKNIIFTLIDE